MEVKALAPFVLLIVAVGMLIGIGIITLDAFSGATYYQGGTVNNSVTVGANISNNALTWGNISVSAVWNGTQGIMPSSCYILDSIEGDLNYTNTSISCDIIEAPIYVIYTYKNYATATAVATTSVMKELSNITTSWIGLIVTVFVLAIILFLVIRSFGGFQR